MKKGIIYLVWFFCEITRAETMDLSHGILHSFDDTPGLLYQKIDGTSHVEVLDSNGDGKVDLLRYSVFDEGGKELLQVEDHEIDGTLDQRWHKVEPSYFEIQHNRKWFRVYGKAQDMYIQTKSGMIEVRLNNGKLSTSNHNK